MTTKENFVLGACSVFNCTPSVVLAALAGSKWPHGKLKSDIRKLARKSVAATASEWRKYVEAVNTKAANALFNKATGGKVEKLPLP